MIPDVYCKLLLVCYVCHYRACQLYYVTLCYGAGFRYLLKILSTFGDLIVLYIMLFLNYCFFLAGLSNFKALIFLTL